MSPHSFLNFVFLCLLSLAAASPLISRSTPIEGTGQLAVIHAGEQVGCLTCLWQMVVDTTLCATFTATVTPTKQVAITGNEGACGYKYHLQDTNPFENAQFLLGCGDTAANQNTVVDFYPGRYSFSDWQVLTIQTNWNFTTIDGRAPVGVEALNIATDPAISRPTDYQIGWLALSN